MRRKPSADAAAALDQAQDLVYDAWEAVSAKRRIALAQQALALSPLCADAYVLLAEHARSGSDEELELWRHGVEAGKAALGAAFAEYVGEFWGFLETRPYMRARCGLAWALWARGGRAEAIDHLRDMLRLNPNDNQGVRYILAAWLLEADRDDDLAALLKAYADDAASEWSWTKTLAAFRRSGDGPQSRTLLDRALADNAHVAAYLLGAKRLPNALPRYISPGSEGEAVSYAVRARAGWSRTPGALDWLRPRSPANAPKPKARKAATRRPKRGQWVH